MSDTNEMPLMSYGVRLVITNGAITPTFTSPEKAKFALYETKTYLIGYRIWKNIV